MKAAARSRRDRIRAQLADLKMPGALEAIDDVLTGIDGGGVTASEAIEQLLGLELLAQDKDLHGLPFDSIEGHGESAVAGEYRISKNVFRSPGSIHGATSFVSFLPRGTRRPSRAVSH